MNEYHSQYVWKYIPRLLTPIFQSAIRDHPIVVVTGARQVGKSTLLEHAYPTCDWPTLTMDDLDVLNEAKRDPASLLFGKSQIIIDEIQKAPQLLSEIKRLVDKNHRNIRLVLSGSANLLLMEQVSETLAGRAVFLTLDSMTIRESRSLPQSKILENLFQGRWPEERPSKVESPSLASLLVRGLIPPVLFLQEQTSVTQWWEGYVSTFLERDLRSVSRIDSLPDFRRCMTALAIRSGQMLNQTEIARDIGVPQPTLHRYINLVDVMCLLHRVPVYTVNPTKRLMKTPKIYWFDTGLAAYLSGYYDEASLTKASEWGSFFEGLVFQHLRVWSSLQIPKARLYYWRTTTGKEVDFVIEYGRSLIAIEVKTNENARYKDLENLRMFLRDYPKQTVAGVLIYTGSEIKQMDEKIVAIPWHQIL
ncbi:ATP-binding protein [candidate division KSB1 bacterium]|nr:ATP-binding protein [candidate division KSB1 bacterium]NIR69071.1 ATP-binding protein [candidate division KSB1 bacterium]NIS27353.1 ATP-binding protein [candidate division KSB1 bacterium]NIT74189.1 ATP-binding protein [candidate division KSB1 bacterium]NIU28066.1 ATP-binding protein [candidate division KSB1 bacterium]